MWVPVSFVLNSFGLVGYTLDLCIIDFIWHNWLQVVMKCGVIHEFMSWQENVSLADVLSLWDSCLTEQDIWAICLECSQSLKSIAYSAIFQTLCITPDTLAFNTNGNVCFMEQISGKYLCFQAICSGVQKLKPRGCSETLYSLRQPFTWILIRLETIIS